MRGEPYTTCTLSCNHWCGDPPLEGAFITTSGGSAYRIEGYQRSRPGSRTWGRIFCTRWPPDEVPADALVYEWEWAPRDQPQANPCG